MKIAFKFLGLLLLVLLAAEVALAFKPAYEGYGHTMITRRVLSGGYEFGQGLTVPEYSVQTSVGETIRFSQEARDQVVTGAQSRDFTRVDTVNHDAILGNCIPAKFAPGGTISPSSDKYVACPLASMSGDYAVYNIIVTGDIDDPDGHFDDDNFVGSARAIHNLLRGIPYWEDNLCYQNRNFLGIATTCDAVSSAGKSVTTLLREYVQAVRDAGSNPTQVIAAKIAAREKLVMARIKLGKALHTLQDFYAHSTWADFYPVSEIFLPITNNLANITSSPDFSHSIAGVPVRLAQPVLQRVDKPTATWPGAVCNGRADPLIFPGLNLRNNGGNYDLTTAARDSKVVSTGMFEFAPNIAGLGVAAADYSGNQRCDHGLDVAFKVSGIAKDTPYMPLRLECSSLDHSCSSEDAFANIAQIASNSSPEHKRASYQAAKHSAELLNKLVEVIRNDRTLSTDQDEAESMIGALLGVNEPPPGTALVVDASASMNQAIRGISAGISLAGKVGTVSLWTYDGAGVTASAQGDKVRMAALLANGGKGGGHCMAPSLAVMRNVVNALPLYSSAYLFTDAGASDAATLEDLVQIANARHVKINPVVMGGCGKDASSSGDYTGASTLIHQTLASRTGGTVFTGFPSQDWAQYMTDLILKRETARASSSGPASLSSRANAAATAATTTSTISSVVAESGTLNQARTLSFPVDTGVEQLMVTVAAEGSQVTLTNPAGVVVPLDDFGNGVFDVTIPNPPTGNWTMVLGAKAQGRYTVQVAVRGGVTLNNVQYESLVEIGGRSGHEYAPALGATPPSGSSVATVQMDGVTASDVTLKYMGEGGALLASAKLASVSPGVFKGKVQVPTSIYWVTVTGTDPQGAGFARMWRGEHALPSPVPTGFVAVQVTPGAWVAGQSGLATITLTNLGADETVSLSARSNVGTVQVSPTTVTLAANTKGTAQLTVAIPATATAGVSAGLIVTVANATGSRDIEVPVTIQAGTAPVCTLNANPANIAVGGSSTLTATCTPAATSYVWTGGTCAGTTAATCTVTPTATTTYTVAGVSAGGAGVAASATVTVTTANTGALQPNADGTVFDPKTGLTWMRCTMGQTWDGSTCLGTASTYTFDQANALTGTTTFASQSDWRMPNIRELQTIVDRSVHSPAIDSVAFPNTPGSYFWSGSPFADYSNFAWIVNFYDGNASYGNRGYLSAVRLVRGGQSFGSLLGITRPTSDYVDNGNGTVTHTPTNLTWKRCAQGQTWTGSTCSGTAGTYTFEQANAFTGTTMFAGQSDWRVPTEDELVSLVDYTIASPGPTINNSVFPATTSSYFWSGSPYALNSHYAWIVDFNFGYAYGHYDRSDGYAVRLVRGGQSFASLALTISKSGTGTGAVSSVPVGISCGSTCSASFNSGSSVTLTATPATGSTFTGWSGACTGTGSCTVSMNAAKSVTATFALNITASVCTLSANPVSINAGGSSTLTATCSPTATSYTWTGGTCAGTSGATCTVSPTATTTYTVKGTNAGGTSAAVSTTVTVASTAAPICTLTANPSSITAGGSSTLTAICNPPATSYIWTGGTCAGTTGTTCTVKPTATTTYSVQGSNASGTNQAASATVTVAATNVPSYTVPGTLGGDVFVLTAGNNYYGGAGNDTYIISPSTLRGGVTAKIIDTEGDNLIQLVDGMTVTASTFYTDAAQLTLSNGATVQILGASKFKYQVGANVLAGDTAAVLTYSEFVSSLGASLSGTLPAAGTAGYVVPTLFTQATTPVPSVAGSSYTVPGTIGDDVLAPSGGNNYLGGGGNDTYIISPYTLSGAVTAKIIDTEGGNVIQLVGGLTIASSTFYSNAVQLMLSNGASVQILGASGFSYQLGANAPAGVTATSLSYAQFAAALGASVPTGTSAVSGSANFVVPYLNVLLPQVSLKTSMGDMLLELYPNNAPITVNNFLQYVSNNFYTNLIFHRVVPDFVIQGGGFNSSGQSATTRAPIKLEVPNGLSNLRGTVAMARTSALDSATSQFYINTVDNVALDTIGGGYTVFGKVVSGLPVVDAISAVPTSNSWPITPVVINSAIQTQ